MRTEQEIHTTQYVPHVSTLPCTSISSSEDPSVSCLLQYMWEVCAAFGLCTNFVLMTMPKDSSLLEAGIFQKQYYWYTETAPKQ